MPKRLRRFRLAPLAAAIVAVLGLGAAVAVASVTGSTATQCATTTAPTHTIGVDGAGVSTVGGDVLSVCATATATDQTVTVTGPTTTVTAPATTTTAPPTTTISNPPTSGGTSGIGVLAYGGNLKSVTGLNGYSMVIGSSYSSDTSLMQAAVGRSLTYFDGTDVATNYSTGVTYTDALANGWLLKNSAGSYMVNSTYGTYCADVGSSSYQAKWIADVESYLSAHPGLDGVFIDNVMADPSSECGGYPAKYPSTSTYSAATVSFVKAVYAALRAKGYYVALNSTAYKSGDSTYNDGTSVVNWWKQVGPYSSGLMNEYYDETAQKALRTTANAWYGYFDGWQRLVGTAQSMGKDFIGLTKSAGMNTTVATYGKASFLLEWNGGSSAYIYTCGNTCDPTNSSWTADIGQPASAKVAVGVGYERAYTGGTVLVNPSPSSSQTFTVNGTSVTLTPTTAKIIAG